MASTERPWELPLLSAGLTGVGGTFGRSPDDFRVEEIPLYPACGQGTHLYITLEKRGISTHELVRRAARVLQVPARDIGYAGLKDAQAVAVQRISAPETALPRLERLGGVPGAKVLEVRRHRNKLRIGHLAGNRFRVLLGNVAAEAAEKAGRILELLARRGVPNGYDSQRFGIFANSHRLGKLLLAGDAAGFAAELLAPAGLPQRSEMLGRLESGEFQALAGLLPSNSPEAHTLAHALARTGDSERAVRSLSRRMRKFYANAYQAYLFNLTFERRGIGELDRLYEGDLAYLHRNGAVFEVHEPRVEQARLDNLEISPSGPLYGAKAPLAAGRQGELEAAVARAEGVTPAMFKPLGLAGDRRPYRVPLIEPAHAQMLADNTLELTFALPAGAYATNLLREVMQE